MTAVEFYTNAESKLQAACRLAAREFAPGKRIVVYASDDALARQFDRMLWTWQAISFVPHCLAHHPLAPETPIVIAVAPDALPAGELLLNLHHECPGGFERFERLIEVLGRDPEELRRGRERYRFYRDRGHPIRHHDLGKSPQ